MISVIVPVFQSENTICRCIDSILSQSFTDIEVIIVDDGSSDDSPRICEEYAQKDSRVKFFRKEHTCVSDTRQIGIDHMSGTYMIHCDSDDWMESDMLKILYDGITSNNSDIFICNFFEEYNDRRVEYVEFPWGFDSSKSVLQQLDYLSFSLCNKLVRTDFFRKNSIMSLPEISYAEDMYLTLKMLNCEPKVSYVSQPLYHYSCSTTDTLSKKLDDNKLSSYKRVVSSLEVHLKEPIMKILNCNKCEILIMAYDQSILSIEQCRDYFPDIHMMLVRSSFRRRRLLPMVINLYRWRALFILPSVLVSTLYSRVSKKMKRNALCL